jgi:Cu/Ag efflux protein CusF
VVRSEYFTITATNLNYRQSEKYTTPGESSLLFSSQSLVTFTKMTVVRVVAHSSLVGVYRCFRSAYCLHHQEDNLTIALQSQKTAILTLAAVRTLSLLTFTSPTFKTKKKTHKSLIIHNPLSALSYGSGTIALNLREDYILRKLATGAIYVPKRKEESNRRLEKYIMRSFKTLTLPFT